MGRPASDGHSPRPAAITLRIKQDEMERGYVYASVATSPRGQQPRHTLTARLLETDTELELVLRIGSSSPTPS